MLATAQIHLGDLPTWLAGVGTVGTLGAALWQIGAERRRRLEREAQEREERHQAQARLIAAVVRPYDSLDNPPVLRRTGIDLINGSAEPVYRLVIAIVDAQGLPFTIKQVLEYRPHFGRYGLTVPITTASILPSGLHRVWIDGTSWGPIVAGAYGAEVAFTDRMGSHWVRGAGGSLRELYDDPVVHYLGRGPHTLQIPERLS
jgi:hypothetical protein